MTLRELVAMAEGREKSESRRQSWLMCLIANIHRDPRKSRAKKPKDFDPFSEENKPVNDIAGLRAAFERASAGKEAQR